MLTITKNELTVLETQYDLGNVIIVTKLSKVGHQVDKIPMLKIEVFSIIDGKVGETKKGYIMPFRRYCFSVQSGTEEPSSQIYMTGAVAPEIFAEIISHDTYGDVFVIPQIVECVTALGGRLPMSRIRGISMELLQNFKAQVINWVMKRSGLEMSEEQNKFVSEQLEPKKPAASNVRNMTPEQLMEAVIRGQVTLQFN